MTLLIYYAFIYHIGAESGWYVLGLFVWVLHLIAHSK